MDELLRFSVYRAVHVSILTYGHEVREKLRKLFIRYRQEMANRVNVLQGETIFPDRGLYGSCFEAVQLMLDKAVF